MRFLLFILAGIFAQGILLAQNSYDIVIVGGTPGGIMTAIAAAREGKTSLILERTAHIGGLPANGLGATDLQTREATTGLFREFVNRMYRHYEDTYGKDSQQVRAASGGYHFEPSLAERTFEQMLSEQAKFISVLRMRQFDSDAKNLSMQDGNIKSIRILNRENKNYETYTAKVFVDATYEGDLGAAAGAPFRIGREGKDEFNEPGAGVIYRYWKHGPEGEGSTFQADNAVQAYNYRLCITKTHENRVPIAKPKHYNREEYLSLIDDVFTGRNTGSDMQKVTDQMMEANRKRIMEGQTSKIPGDPWGIYKITNIVHLPNGKTDANNQHMAFLSTDLPEENWPWPSANWEWRDRYAKRLRDYTLGLFWFAQHDEALPEHFRNACKEWGLAKDEYTDNANFPRQVYVREGRRFEGEYFFTAKDAIPVSEGKRPPLHATSITASHYALDSHAVRKREEDRVHLEGFLSYPTAVYTVPFGVIVPKKVNNLLIPVPVSGSHIGFSTLRMEPCWMALGQAAGIAGSLSIDSRKAIRDVDVTVLQKKLIDQKATLIYFKDVRPDNPDFAMLQYMGLRGYVSYWEAKLDDTMTDEIKTKWETLSGLKLGSDVKTKREGLTQIYQKLSQERK